MLAVLAPGQGSQTPGMLSPWLDLPGVEQQIAEFSDLAGLDLRRLGTTADAAEIKDTAVTQPLIVALGLVAAGQLNLQGDGVVVAGHSAGELTAAAVSGAIGAADAVAFAARRGAEMAAACALTPTGMSALLGGDPDEVVAAIAAGGLTAANRNGAGQVVAAGSLDALAELAKNPPNGARVRPLPVAGAFHTHYMGPAEEALADFSQSLNARNPEQMLLSNADGASMMTGHDVLGRLVRQVTRPVRWDLCLDTLRHLKVTVAIELPPAGALTGIAKRELPGVQLLALKSPDDLAAARAAVGSVSHDGQGEHTVDFQIVVSPAKGIFHPAPDAVEGELVRRGARIGTIATNRDEHAVVAGSAGVLAEWLKHDGDIVGAGLPVARVQTGSED
ncbi:MAG: acyltransferase domain-containing protein [Jatrophihabitans sp.]